MSTWQSMSGTRRRNGHYEGSAVPTASGLPSAWSELYIGQPSLWVPIWKKYLTLDKLYIAIWTTSDTDSLAWGTVQGLGAGKTAIAQAAPLVFAPIDATDATNNVCIANIKNSVVDTDYSNWAVTADAEQTVYQYAGVSGGDIDAPLATYTYTMEDYDITGAGHLSVVHFTGDSEILTRKLYLNGYLRISVSSNVSDGEFRGGYWGYRRKPTGLSFERDSDGAVTESSITMTEEAV